MKTLLNKLRSLVVYGNFAGHCHDFGRWQPWGITYQVRYCEKCNKSQLRSL